MEVVAVSEFSKTLLNNLNKLLLQLSASAKPLEETDLRDILQSSSVHLLLAQDDGEVFGTLTLVVFPILTGTRAWIEDVVVSESARGKGVGRLLTNRAIELATELNAKTIDLTSRPSRAAPNSLYQTAGFQRRESNVYRYNVKGCLLYTSDAADE